MIHTIITCLLFTITSAHGMSYDSDDDLTYYNLTPEKSSKAFWPFFGSLLFTPPQSASNAIKKLDDMGNIYNPEPTSIAAPLDEEHVLNTYWKNIGQQNQKSKDDALKNILEIDFTNSSYHLRRYHLAAATYAGANLSIQENEALCIAARNQDYELCKLLFEKGLVNPNITPSLPNEIPLFNVKKYELAKLFLQHGANIQIRSTVDYNLLMYATASDYEPRLVSLYRSKGLSPLYTNLYNETALYSLAQTCFTHKIPDLKDKLFALFENLSPEESAKLINIKSTTRTVFDQLSGIHTNEAMDYMRNFLLSKLNECKSNIAEKNSKSEKEDKK